MQNYQRRSLGHVDLLRTPFFSITGSRNPGGLLPQSLEHKTLSLLVMGSRPASATWCSPQRASTWPTARRSDRCRDSRGDDETTLRIADPLRRTNHRTSAAGGATYSALIAGDPEERA